ncbi:MAG: cytochrome C biosynthesis protein [Bacteroidales bacterium]
MKKFLFPLLFLGFITVLLIGCRRDTTIEIKAHSPKIWPDYSGVTLPFNIAPPNFYIIEPHQKYKIRIFGSVEEDTIFLKGKNLVEIPIKAWKKLLSKNKNKNIYFSISLKTDRKWHSYQPIINLVKSEKLDPFLVYRLIEPSYQMCNYLITEERNLENYQRRSLFDNTLTNKSCVNCHTFSQNNPNYLVYHVRFFHSGTYILRNGKYQRLNLNSDRFAQGGVYPAWHPSGNFIAFATGKAIPFVHAKDIERRTEVFDSLGDIMLYDLEKNVVISDSRMARSDYEETFPTWSPDGKYLYFCQSKTPNRDSNEDFTSYSKKIKYDLVRIAFNAQTSTFGSIETLISHTNTKQTVSFPRISPNGKYLVFCLSDHGTFPIRHPESDLYILNLKTLVYRKMEAINSPKTESYHTFSSNGHWMVFSSKRGDGMYARPYFTYIDKHGKSSKPFLLPEKDPNFYVLSLKSFNVPELVKGSVNTSVIKSQMACEQEIIYPQAIKVQGEK